MNCEHRNGQAVSAIYGKIAVVKSFVAKVQIIADLQKFAERTFVYKLKKRDPYISDEGIAAAVNAWYKDRPRAPFGDGMGKIGDSTRFRQPK